MMQDFEKEMKKHFQERQIQPSENAWNKMETLLDEQQPGQKKPKILFYFLSAAASVLLFVGLWTFFQKVDPSLPETNQEETFVVNDEQETMKPTETDDKKEIYSEKEEEKTAVNNSVRKKLLKHKNDPKIIVEKIVFSEEELEEEQIVTVSKEIDHKNEPLIAARSNVEITVNPQRLLQSAEIERQIENATTEGQNFWKKVGEKHQLVQSH